MMYTNHNQYFNDLMGYSLYQEDFDGNYIYERALSGSPYYISTKLSNGDRIALFNVDRPSFMYLFDKDCKDKYPKGKHIKIEPDNEDYFIASIGPASDFENLYIYDKYNLVSNKKEEELFQTLKSLNGGNDTKVLAVHENGDVIVEVNKKEYYLIKNNTDITKLKGGVVFRTNLYYLDEDGKCRYLKISDGIDNSSVKAIVSEDSSIFVTEEGTMYVNTPDGCSFVAHGCDFEELSTDNDELSSGIKDIHEKRYV